MIVFKDTLKFKVGNDEMLNGFNIGFVIIKVFAFINRAYYTSNAGHLSQVLSVQFYGHLIGHLRNIRAPGAAVN